MQNRRLLWSHLEQAQRHVAEGFNHLQVQRKIVADLERSGHEKPLTMARKILQQFESVQEERLSDRDRLFEALERHSGTWPMSARSRSLRENTNRNARMPIKQPPTMPTEFPDGKKPSAKDRPPQRGGDRAMQDEADIALREEREKVERAARDRDDPATDVSGPDVDFFDPDLGEENKEERTKTVR
jgi:hypothetical protein